MQSRCTSNIPRIAIALAVSLMLAFMPFTVNLEKYRISLERNEAIASPVVLAGAYSFLEEAANAAGFESVGDFIATGVGITAVSTGYNIANSSGVNFGRTASENLSGLIPSDEYPEWSTLSSTEQQSWGSEDDYNAQKFNTLMSSFGLGTDYDNYISTWGNFTPGQFQFSSDGLTQLGLIGEVGQALIDGYSKPLEAIMSCFTSTDGVYEYAGVRDYKLIDGSQIEGWPSSIPTNVYVNKATKYVVNKTSNSESGMGTNNEVYWVIFMQRGSSSKRIVDIFDKVSFQFYNLGSPETTYEAQSKTYDDKSWYESVQNKSYSGTLNDSLQVSGSITPNYTDITTMNRLILYGNEDLSGIGQLNSDIPNYPGTENLQPSIEIYFPEGGITNDTTWDELISHVENIEGNLDTVIALLRHIDNDLHDLNIPGEPDLTPIISYLQTIDSHIQGLDFLTSSDLQPYYTLLQHIDSDLHKFIFYQSGELKVHDEGVFTELSDIYALLLEISGKMGNWGDLSDAPEIIGDFDFDEIDDKIPNLLDTIKELAPFGSVLLLSEMYTILANFAQIEEPVMTFPFDFGGLPGQDTDLTIDLSWLDDIKPVINFFCILMLLLAITHATIRIVELEAAS